MCGCGVVRSLYGRLRAVDVFVSECRADDVVSVGLDSVTGDED